MYHLFLGADNLCGRLMEKINSSNNVKQALAHMPLILVCMEVFFLIFNFIILYKRCNKFN